MSTTIDQRVVEMRFDNQHFEKNVSTTMSSLDKLKQSLNFTGASKGLNTLSAAAGNVNMSSLANSVETVRARFSALEVMGVTALANITNSAVNAGKRMISALTIDPVKTGLSEYETQMNAVQTILANTQSKGTQLEDVNAALDELNKYADQTIYNFTEMTRNIGTFTAAGVGLNESVSAIKGIANLAAVSGSTSQQASTAMYQLSQALATGTVKLQDWNSVVNAGMGGEVFQNALVRTAATMAGAAENVEAWRKKNIDSYGSFRDSLTKGEWLTSEVLTKTLEQFTMYAKEGTKEWEEYKKSLLDQGYTEKQAEEILKMANTATEAATKVKTFTQLWDVMKESAQSGWSQTWKLIIGDFEEAKSLLSPLAETLTGFIGRMSDARNNILEGVLNFSAPWQRIMDKFEDSGLGTVKKVAETVSNMTHGLEYFQDVVNKVWRGDYMNSDTGRFEMLEAAGYDHRVVQDLVNKGLDYKLTMEDVEASHKKFGLTMSETTTEVTDLTSAIDFLTDKQLEEAGLTEHEIRLYRDLAAESKRTGKSISELADEMSKTDGRQVLINSFKNVGSTLVAIFGTVKNAWSEIFDPISVVKLYNALKSVEAFSEGIKKWGKNKDNLDKLTRSFKGLFAVIDIITTVVGGGFKMAFNILSQVLSYFDMDILDLTARIGDAIVKFRDWIDAGLDITGILDVVVPLLISAADAMKEWFGSIKGSDSFKNFVNSLKEAKEALSDWFSGLKDVDNIPQYILEGLVNGLKNGAKLVVDTIIFIGKTIIDAICGVLGINSPSTVFFAIGGFIIAGLVAGLLAGGSEVKDTLKELGSDISEWFDELDLAAMAKKVGSKISQLFSGIDFGKILAAGLGVGMLVTANKLIKVLEVFASPLEGVGDMLTGLGNMFEDIGASFKAKAWERRSKAILNFALAILMMVGALAVLTKLDSDRLWASVGALAALAGIVAALATVSTLLNKIGPMGGQSISLLALSTSVLILSFALEKVASIDGGDMQRALQSVLALAGIISGLAAVSILINKIGPNIATGVIKLGGTLIGISVALLLMAGTIKIISMLSQNDIEKGLIVMGALGLLVVALVKVSKLAGQNASKAGSMLLKISIALLIMVGVIAIAANLDEDAVKKGLAIIASIELLFVAIIAVSKLAGKNASKAGTMLILMSAALAITATVLKQVAQLEEGDVKKGIAVIAAIEILFAAIIAVSRLAGQNAMKAGVMLLAMSVALGILVGLLFIVSKLDPSGIGRALGVIATLEILFGGLIAVTKLASECKGTLITITVAISILVAALIALSIIDPEGLASATTAISTVLVAFGLLIAMTGKLKGMKAPIGVLVMLTAVVAGIAAIIGTMAGLGVEASIKTAGSISLLLATMSAAILVLSKTRAGLTGAVGNLALMGVVVLELAAILGVMAYLNVEGSLKTATALSVLLVAMSTAMLILSSTRPGLAGSVGCLMLMGVVVLELAVILGAMAYLKVEASIPTAVSLSVLLIAMAAALKIIAPIGPIAGSAAAAIGVLMLFIAAVGALLVGLGALATYWDGMETFLDKGIPILEKIGYGLGSFVGNLIGGVLGGIAMSSLAAIGTGLSDFMTNLTPFLDGCENIDQDIVDGISALAKAFLILSGASLMDGLMSLFGGGSSITEFSSQLPQLGKDFKSFADNLGEFTPDQVLAVTSASNAILALANAAKQIPNDGGIWASICGDNSIATFGAKLPNLAKHISSFITNLGEFTPDQVTTAKLAGDVIAALAEAAQKIPNDGGLWGALCGENSIAVFGAKLPTVATCLSAFIANLGALSEEQVITAGYAGDVIVALAKAAEAIPNDGGLWGALCGENSIAVFGANLPSLASNISAFISNLGAFAPEQVQAAKYAGEVIVALAEAAQQIPNEGGLWAKIVGDNGLSSFSSSFGELGDNIKKLVEGIGSLTKEQVSGLQNGLTAITTISAICGQDMNIGNIKDFGKNISSLADELTDFSDDMSEISTSDITGALNKVKDVISTIKGITSADSSSVKSFGDSLNKLGKDGISKFVKALTGSTATTDIKSAASKLVKSFTDKIDDSKSDVESSFSKLVTAGVDKIKTKTNYSKFKSAGKYLVEGFAQGIKDNKSKATSEAQAMVDAVEAIVREGLAINSPSKVFIDIGSSIPEGFAMGIEKMRNVVTNSSAGLGNVAIAGIRDSLSRVADAINSDVDTQPTIRPVIDMTDVETKANTINRMFNNDTAFGVTARVNAISTTMNSRQNGNNDDVVSAIKDLRKGIGENRGDTYVIDGITYDDGSNVASAVKTLIGAVRREGRN